MPTYLITYSGKPMRIGGFGTAATGYQVAVTAPTEQEAIEEGRRILREERNAAEYANGKARIDGTVRNWKVVLCGRDDRRRKETFFLRGPSKQSALRQLGWNSAAQRFAGYIRERDVVTRAGKTVKANVVSVEDLGDA